MVWLRRLVTMTLILHLALAVGPAAAGTPTEELKKTIDEFIDIMKNPALKDQRLERRRLMKQVIDRRFDYEEMAKRCLGVHWQNLSPGQRSEFTRLFAELLERSYGDKFDTYHGEKVAYGGEELEGNYASVRTTVLRPNDKIPMNYSLIKESGRWMVYDVTIEGVSLVNNYRSQFQTIIRQSSYSGLVARLRTKVAELRRTDPM
jgi:phospholipid transport system substrate-binding protein